MIRPSKAKSCDFNKSPNVTITAILLVQPRPRGDRSHREICPKYALLADKYTRRTADDSDVAACDERALCQAFQTTFSLSCCYLERKNCHPSVKVTSSDTPL